MNDMYLLPLLTKVNPKQEDENANQKMEDDLLSKLPDEMPILPLRGVVVYPETTVPLTIGQPRSIRLVDDVIAKDRVIGLVSTRDPELENPGPEDLFTIGTIAVINRLFRAPDGTIRLLIQGIARFKLGEFTQFEPYFKARIQLIPGNTGNRVGNRCPCQKCPKPIRAYLRPRTFHST